MSQVTVKGHKIIVVGGGLAGLSAAHTILERGGRVLILDKLEFLGGNSVKATSGINGAGTSVQAQKQIFDNSLSFEQDTARGGNGGKDMPATPLMKVLTHNSGSSVEWLINNFGLDLTLLSRLGGHSFPRTHRGKERFPGMTITYALMEKFENICEKNPDIAQVLTLARVTKLIQDENGNVLGVEYERKGQNYKEYGPVILTTGGYGADFSPNSVIAKYRPDLINLPTTNGDHCTGDGLQMVMNIGGASVDLKWVQVHPTGLVNPKEPDARLKFLAAEALRGVGGIMLDKNGKRFVNELGTRDYVTGKMWECNSAPYRLVLNGKASNEISWHCAHYVGRGLMKRFEGIESLARELNVNVDILKTTFKEHNEAEKSKNDKFGKKFFHNGPWIDNDIFHVAIITPVVHYTMGGIKIDKDACVLSDKDKPIKGLYAAGEAAGGVHGINRLGGSGLLGCVVFGRVAGDSASKELLEKTSQETTLNAINRINNLTNEFLNIKVDNLGKNITIQINSDLSEFKTNTNSKTETNINYKQEQVLIASQKEIKQHKKYDMNEVSKHNTEKDCWIVVNNQVLDVTNFLNRHPGGKASMMLFAGKDATSEFNMLHKPDVIKKYASDCIIGDLAPNSKL
jgi:flavocytochrome c